MSPECTRASLIVGKKCTTPSTSTIMEDLTECSGDVFHSKKLFFLQNQWIDSIHLYIVHSSYSFEFRQQGKGLH